MRSSAISNPVRLVSLSERVELLKWLGVLLMLWDHSKYLLGNPYVDLGGLPGWQVMGRGAFPLFALAFGYALSVAPDSRALLTRLLYAGVCAEALGAWHLTGADLNVMFTFALATWLIHARRASASPARYLLKAGIAALLSSGTEYGLAGLALVLVAEWYWQRPSWIRVAALLAASLLLVVPDNSFYGAAWLAVGLALTQVPIGLPRVKRAFYIVYVAQWPLLWVIQ